MASLLSSTCRNLCLFFLISHCFYSTNALLFPLSQESICSLTYFPNYCKSMLATTNGSLTVFAYSRLSLYHSISKTNAVLSLINRYLGIQHILPYGTVQALEDCRFLAQLNEDYLSNAIESIGAQSNTLERSKADELHTYLSATLTNTETCSDGIKATSSDSSVGKIVLASLFDASRSYSVSLALFLHGCGHRANEDKGLIGDLSDLNKVLPFSWDSSSSKQMSTHKTKRVKMNDLSHVKVSQMVIVNPDGSGNFTSISDAVYAAPNNTDGSKGYFIIRVVAGVYQEYVSIPSNKRYIMMIGDGINRTIITGNRSMVDGSTTFNSATFAVVGRGFVAINITIKNTAGAIKHQAVALRNSADLSAFYKCSFEGHQDTLYAHSMRQLYKQCDIYGTVDFIFGNAAVVFQDCNIYARLPLPDQYNAITAQGRTDANQNTGTSIQNCKIMASGDLSSSNRSTQTFLGRPWKEYSRTVYMQSFIARLIDPAGWKEWSGDFALSTLYYAEFGNSGSGSDTSRRVTWPGFHVISSNEAVNFTVSNFIQGDYWLPSTCVPYKAGLF